MHEVPFLVASTVPRTLIVVSEVASALGHWDFTASGFRHCAPANCHLCREGWGREVRYLVRLEEEEGSEYLLWLRPRHAQLVEEILRAQNRGLTLRVSVVRAGQAKNSPVNIRSLAEVSSPPLYQVANLLAALMLPAIMIERDGSKVEFAPSEGIRKC